MYQCRHMVILPALTTRFTTSDQHAHHHHASLDTQHANPKEV